MIKQFIRFNYILCLLLIATNAFAHHSEDNYEKIVIGEKESLKREYCIGNAQITRANENDIKEKKIKSPDKKKNLFGNYPIITRKNQENLNLFITFLV